MRVPVLLIGLFYWVLETRYFGGNSRPESDAEVIADGIALLIIALSFLW